MKWNLSLKQFGKNSSILILLTTLMMMVLAHAVSASFTDNWGEWQDDPTNLGRVGDETANFDGVQGITISTTTGKAHYQPLSIQYNSQDYLLIPDGNTIKSYIITQSGGSISDEQAIAASMTSPLTALNTTHGLFVMTSNITHVLVYNFTGTFTLSHSPLVIGAANNISGSAIKCAYSVDTGTPSTGACYFVSTRNDVCEFNASYIAGNATCTSLINSTYSTVVRYPVVNDIDNDGYVEIVFTHGQNVTVYDTNSQTLDWTVNLATGTSPSLLSSPLVYQSDGGGIGDGIGWWEWFIGGGGAFTGGFKEVAVAMTTYSPASSDPRIILTVLNGEDGTTDDTISYDGTSPFGPGSYYVPTVAGCDFDLDQTAVCAIGRTIQTGSNNPYTLLICGYDNSTDFERILEIQMDTEAYQSLDSIACADMDGDGVDEIVTPLRIYNIDETQLQNFSGAALDSTVTLADVDGDSELEVIVSTASSTKIFFSTFENLPPTIWNNLSYGGYFGYYNPVCVNTTITFEAQECGGTVTDCNYDNDASEDTERIVTNCGFDTSGSPNSNPDTHLENGTPALANPQFSCYYNQTGVFNVRMYLQDQADLTDYTVYNTQKISLTVIDGVQGVTCNVPGSYVSDPGDQAAEATGTEAIDSAIDSTLGILFGTSQTVMLIVSMGVTIGLAVAAATVAGPVGFAGAALLSSILFTFLGMLPAWIFILILISMVLMVVISKFITNNGQGG